MTNKQAWTRIDASIIIIFHPGATLTDAQNTWINQLGAANGWYSNQ
jgi:hypothetical protein